MNLKLNTNPYPCKSIAIIFFLTIYSFSYTQPLIAKCNKKQSLPVSLKKHKKCPRGKSKNKNLTTEKKRTSEYQNKANKASEPQKKINSSSLESFLNGDTNTLWGYDKATLLNRRK